MAVDRDLARVNFARFVQSALDAARARGLTDLYVAGATGVGTSTFHRWRRGDWGQEWPKIDQIIKFCVGLGIPEEDAFAALGLRGERTPAPAPLDPDVIRILRRLADPSTPKTEKDAIRHLLRSLAMQASAGQPAATPKPSTRPLRKRREA